MNRNIYFKALCKYLFNMPFLCKPSSYLLNVWPGKARLRHFTSFIERSVSRNDPIRNSFGSEGCKLSNETPTLDASGQEVIHSVPLSIHEREALYKKTLSQDFYGEGYGATRDWLTEDESSKLKAYYINKYLSPKNCIEIGCANGKLVFELRKNRIEAFGLDYSEYFISKAHPEIKQYLRCVALENALPAFKRKFDLVICLEVLEHIPSSIIETTLEDIKNISAKNILITVPSHGPNIQGPYGFPMHHCEDWVQNARLNRSFLELPIYKKNGLPHCGHITLATYRWWTDKFIQHHLVRNYPLELQITSDPQTGFSDYGWCLYILREVKENQIIVGQDSAYQIGVDSGIEESIEGIPIRWSNHIQEFFLKANNSQPKALSLKLYGGPQELIYPQPFSLEIKQISDEPDSLAYQTFAKQDFIINPGKWGTFQINLSQIEIDCSKLIVGHIKLDKTWKPPDIFNSFIWKNNVTDTRPRGIAFAEALLE